MAQKTLEERIEHVEAYQEIQNLMSRYAYCHTAGERDEQWSLFAQNAPGLKSEIAGRGICDGIEGVKRNWAKREGDVGGGFVHHPITTPLIEIAADGKTAKALFTSAGLEAGFTRPDGKKQARWTRVRYAVDCIKENGKWKFWHFHIFVIFCCDWDKAWGDGMREFPPEDDYHGRIEHGDALKPDRPPTSDPKISSTKLLYTLPRSMGHVPPLPQPYETWDDSMSYIG